MTWVQTFKKHLQHTCDFWTGKAMDRYSVVSDIEKQVTLRKKQSLKERQAEIVHSDIDAKIVRIQNYSDEKKVNYLCHLKFLIKQNSHFYVEEGIQERMATFKKDKLELDVEVAQSNNVPMSRDKSNKLLREERDKLSYRYNRLEAVKYADKWWNRHNPAYKSFEVDCTNYISQCLHAGGIPMHGMPNRTSGWWYNGSNWSYSWSVANALYWYLNGSGKGGLRAKTVENPQQLVPGDVICYDWEGDGKWNHNVIVTDKDAMGMPLVNAHTYNSRHRYWEYKDSPAWTEKTQYKFFKITDEG